MESLKTDFPESKIEVICGDGNQEIRRLCDNTNWRSTRAVMFVDPYGMQVEWSTIERIAATQAVDLWLLFPLGMGVNRLLKKDGDLPESWRNRLNVLLGTTEWEQEFYRVEPVRTLFGTDESRIEKASMDVIGRYFNDRLRSIFPAVAERPGILWNSKRSPLYLFCFAAANPGRGGEIALNIANHILKDLT